MGSIETRGTIGATKALSNLSNVAINTALLPESHNTLDFGDDAVRWKDGYYQGTLTVYDLVVESGASIKLAGATFENQGHYTSVDTNWVVQHDDQDTAFIGVYAESTDIHTHANLVLDAQGSSFNLVKNSPLHPWSPEASGIINEGGGHGTFVDHNNRVTWWHFDSLVKDVYDNITDLTNIQMLMSLDNDHLILEEVDLEIQEIATGDPLIHMSTHDASFIDAGYSFGVGTQTPNAKVDILDTTGDQLRLSNDDTKYATFEVGSNGRLRIDNAVGEVGFGKDPEMGYDWDFSGILRSDDMVTGSLIVGDRQNGLSLFTNVDNDIDLIHWDTLSSAGVILWDDSAGAYRFDNPLRLNQDNVDLGGVLWLDESNTGPSTAEGGAGHQIWAGSDHTLKWTDEIGNVETLSSDVHTHTELWTRTGTELTPTTSGDDVKAEKFIVDGSTDYTI